MRYYLSQRLLEQVEQQIENALFGQECLYGEQEGIDAGIGGE